jgi:hypothetical protein
MLTEKEEFVFFSSNVFSQWYISKFVDKDTKYNSAEQFMMAQKAILFKDENTLDKIMSCKIEKATDNRQVKDLGRQVQGFDFDIWKNSRFSILLIAQGLKFSQNSLLCKELLDTGLKTLVEATYDNIYGAGLLSSDPLIQDRKNWTGLNLLGTALTMTREFIKLDQML